MNRLHRLHREDGGWMAIWFLGFLVILMFLGGLSFDLWTAFSARRALSGIADSAAVAGASQIDLDRYRDDGAIILIPGTAEQVAEEQATALGADMTQSEVARYTSASASASSTVVQVTVDGTVQPTLVKVLLPGVDGFAVRVVGRAQAVGS